MDHMQCEVCKEFFNKANLSEVVEHMHEGVSTDKEYFGKEKESGTQTS